MRSPPLSVGILFACALFAAACSCSETDGETEAVAPTDASLDNAADVTQAEASEAATVDQGPDLIIFDSSTHDSSELDVRVEIDAHWHHDATEEPIECHPSFHGGGWTPTTPGCRWTGLRGEFVSMRGSSENDVYAVGAAGMVLHYNGQEWLNVDLGIVGNLNSVWGSSSSDVFMGGSGGIRHFDGSSWKLWTQTNTDLAASGASDLAMYMRSE